MNGKFVRTMGPILALALVGGCQALGTGSHHGLATSLGDADMSSYFAQSLAEGRAHLLANRPAAALNAYRQASYDPASRATAYNGMAIAADRLGRPDLAERYFLQAMALAPENASFAANLLRFQNRQPEDTGLAELDSGTADTSPAAPDEPAETARMRHVSEREVTLSAASDAQQATPDEHRQRNPRVRVETRPLARDTQSSRYPVRVAIAPQPVREAEPDRRTASQSRARRLAQAGMIGPRAPNYPVRIRFNQARGSESSQQYPIRVQLDQS